MAQTVEVEDEIYEVLKERAGEKGFDTTDEYVSYVLGQVADKIERKRSGDENEQDFSQEDEQKVKKRLKQLGYLD
jgi:hypothetical protein